MGKHRGPSLADLADEYGGQIRAAERRAMARMDLVAGQDERWAIHAEHVKERIALTLAFLDKLPLEVVADQIEGLKKTRQQHERELARTGRSYHQGSVELFTRLIAASEKRLEERKAEVDSPTSA